MKRKILLTLLLAFCTVVMFAKPYKVTASKLNVRNAPNTSGAVVGSVTQNKQVDVVKISNGWAQINYNGQKAYVSAQYLTPAAGGAAESYSSSSSSKSSSSSSSFNADFGTHCASGFHFSIGAFYALHTGKVYYDIPGHAEWKDVKWGKNDAGHGFSVGFGFEYNGVLHHGANVNICLGFRSGIYYDWVGTKKLKPSDFSSDADYGDYDFDYGDYDYGDYDYGDWSNLFGANMKRISYGGIDLGDFDLGDISDYLGGDGGSGSGAMTGSFKTLRYSIHSITVPLQAQFALEFKGGKMAAGVFSGPVFEFFIANNTITEYDGDNVLRYNAINGKSKWVKGEGDDPKDRDKAYRMGVFNFMWGSGVFIQFNKFRLSVESDWSFYYRYQRGGTIKGQDIDPIKAHYNRPLVAGFQIVF